MLPAVLKSNRNLMLDWPAKSPKSMRAWRQSTVFAFATGVGRAGLKTAVEGVWLNSGWTC